MKNKASIMKRKQFTMALLFIVSVYSVVHQQRKGSRKIYQNKCLEIDERNQSEECILNEQKRLQAEQYNFHLVNQINLKQEDGAVRSFSSIQYSTFNDISMVTLTENNRVIVYVCDASMVNCNKSKNVQIDQSVQIYASSLSDDRKILVTGGSNGKLYVYERTQTMSGQFTFVGTLDESNAAIKTTKMSSKGFNLFAGGSQKVARYYKFNSSNPKLYSFIQAFSPTPSQIITVSNLQVAARNNYVFLAYDQGVRVHILNTTTGKFEEAYTMPINSISVIASPVTVTSQGVGVLAVGCNDGSVKMYQFLNSTINLTLVQNITYSLGAIVSLSLSQNGKFLIIGNHNYDTFLYKKNVLANGTYNWTLFETLRFSQDLANFAKVVKFKPDGNFFITGSDDLYLRFFGYGPCPDDSTFDGFGRCIPKSYVVIYIILAVLGVLIIGLVILFFKKKKNIPAQVKQPLVDIQQDDFKIKTDREPLNAGKQKSGFYRQKKDDLKG